MSLLVLFQIVRWLLPLWSMAAIFDTENNECSQDDYIAPVFAISDNSGVSNPLILSCSYTSDFLLMMVMRFF